MKRKILTSTFLSSDIFSRLSAIINAVFTKGYKKHYNRNIIKVNSIATPFLIGSFKFDSHTILILLLCVVFVLAFAIIVFCLSFIKRKKRLKTNGELTQGNNTQCLEKKGKTGKKYKQFPLIRLASLIIPLTVLAVIFAARLDTNYSVDLGLNYHQDLTIYTKYMKPIIEIFFGSDDFLKYVFTNQYNIGYLDLVKYIPQSLCCLEYALMGLITIFVLYVWYLVLTILYLPFKKLFSKLPTRRVVSLIIPLTILAVIFLARLDKEYSNVLGAEFDTNLTIYTNYIKPVFDVLFGNDEFFLKAFFNQYKIGYMDIAKYVVYLEYAFMAIITVVVLWLWYEILTLISAPFRKLFSKMRAKRKLAKQEKANEDLQNEIVENIDTDSHEEEIVYKTPKKRFPFVRVISFIIPLAVLAVIFLARLDKEYSKELNVQFTTNLTLYTDYIKPIIARLFGSDEFLYSIFNNKYNIGYMDIAKYIIYLEYALMALITVLVVLLWYGIFSLLYIPVRLFTRKRVKEKVVENKNIHVTETNFDVISNDEEVVEETIEVQEEIVEEPAAVEQENVQEETIEVQEEVAEEDESTIVDSTNDEDVIKVFDEQTKTYNIITLDKSFEAKLSQSNDVVKSYYDIVKNELLSYKKVKSKISFKHEVFRVKGKIVAKLKFRGKTLCLYLALDPLNYENTKYKVKDMSAVSSSKDVPTMYRINLPRRVVYSKQLVSDLMSKNEVLKIETQFTNYSSNYPYESNEELLEKGLIKKSVKSITEKVS